MSSADHLNLSDIQKDFLLGMSLLHSLLITTVLIALLRLNKNLKLVSRLLLSFHGTSDSIIDVKNKSQIPINWFEDKILKYFGTCELLSLRAQCRDCEDPSSDLTNVRPEASFPLLTRKFVPPHTISPDQTCLQLFSVSLGNADPSALVVKDFSTQRLAVKHQVC